MATAIVVGPDKATAAAPTTLTSFCEVFSANAWFRGRALTMEPEHAERFNQGLRAELSHPGLDWFRVVSRSQRGDDWANGFLLAQQRAEVVVRLLVGYGIRRDRVEVVIEQVPNALDPSEGPTLGQVNVNRMVLQAFVDDFLRSGAIC